MFNIFKKKQQPTICGITEAEYNCTMDLLEEAYKSACDRQRTCDSKPSGYMKGLACAIKIVGSTKPHNLGGN